MKNRRSVLYRLSALALGAGGLGALLPHKTLAQTAPNPGRTTDRPPYNWLERKDVRQFLAEVSRKHQLPMEWLEKQFRPLGIQPRVLLLINPPPPGPDEPPRKRSWIKYLSQHADAIRVQEGREFLKRYQKTFDQTSRQSGVPASVIAAIIGVETRYGKFTGRFPTLETLTTLAFESPRRADFFRSELEALLIMGHQGVIDLTSVQGSFAGALGIPQFMPSSWRNFALGAGESAKPDLLASFEDAIVSVGNFLKRHGWKAGEPSHSPAIISAKSDPTRFVAPKLEPIHTVLELQKAGIEQQIKRFTLSSAASLIDLPEADDTVQYWIAGHNFFVITQYNRSFMYAAAVLTLSEQLSA